MPNKIDYSLVEVRQLIKIALIEDRIDSDVTSNSIVDSKFKNKAHVFAKEKLVFVGAPLVDLIKEEINAQYSVETLVKDGETVEKGQAVIGLEGSVLDILRTERVLLNFLGRLSGIATVTSQYVEKVSGFKAKIFDTRKTIPCFRILEKGAVRIGGGYNHRFDLSDGMLIKENHIKCVSGITEAIEKARDQRNEHLKLEVEVESVEQLSSIIGMNVDVIMLDNFEVKDIRLAVDMVSSLKPRPLLDVSGGIDLNSVRPIAEMDVDMISIGRITHSAPFGDFTLLVE